MPHPTGTTNRETAKLIAELRKSGYKELARYLRMPARSRKAVNIQKISKLSEKSSAFAIPAKVLSLGELYNPVDVYALSFSAGARDKIAKTGGRALPLKALLKDKPKARMVV